MKYILRSIFTTEHNANEMKRNVMIWLHRKWIDNFFSKNGFVNFVGLIFVIAGNFTKNQKRESITLI